MFKELSGTPAGATSSRWFHCSFWAHTAISWLLGTSSCRLWTWNFMWFDKKRTALGKLETSRAWDVLCPAGTVTDPRLHSQALLSSPLGLRQEIIHSSVVAVHKTKIFQQYLGQSRVLVVTRNRYLGDQGLPLLHFQHGKVLFLSLWFYFNSSCLPFHNKENTLTFQEIFCYCKSLHLSTSLVVI